MVKIIRAISGEAIVVDEEDHPLLSQFRWSVHRNAYANVYANRSDRRGGRPVSMHRMIMNPPSDMVVDHINGCGLDNRRENLRVVTKKENANNIVGRISKPGHNPTTPYLGVSKDESGKYRSYINNKGRQKWIGSFDTAEEAAKARDSVAFKLFGDRARLNFSDSTSGQVDRSEMQLRSVMRVRGPGDFLGVHQKWKGRGFVSKISNANKRHYLGTFETEREAALAYDSVALYFGHRRGDLNLPDEPTIAKPPEEVRVKMPARSATGYLGVWKKYNRYVARMVRDGVLYRLGTYATPEEAARAYDAKAIELGDTVNLNFPNEHKGAAHA